MNQIKYALLGLSINQLSSNNLVWRGVFWLSIFCPFICFSQWTSQNSNTTTNLFGVHFPDASNGWTVGADGFISKSSDGGENWTSQTSSTIRTRDGVFMIDASTGFSVGDRAIVSSTTDGGSMPWVGEQITGFNGVFMHDVHFPTSSTGYIAANNGHIFKKADMMPWESVRPVPNVATRFRDIYFIDENTGWVVGEGGHIRKTTNGGTSWPIQMSQGGIQFHGVYFIDAMNGWVVGSGGIIKVTTNGGDDWDTQDTPVTSLLKAVDFIDAMNGWAVGSGGVILRTENGGDDWYLQPADVSVDLHDVHAFSDQVAVAVGVNGTVLKTTNGGGMLPVELTFFSAKINKENNVALTWQTANEQNNSGFEVQWSRTGEAWQKLGFVKGNGDSHRSINYSFYHNSPLSGTNYYRLKQLDYDGAFSFSAFEVVEVETKKDDFQIYPNPIDHSELYVYSLTDSEKETNYRLFSTEGLLLQQGVLLFNGQEPIKIALVYLNQGAYILQLHNENAITTHRIIVQ